jgi:hypothetical protein
MSESRPRLDTRRVNFVLIYDACIPEPMRVGAKDRELWVLRNSASEKDGWVEGEWLREVGWREEEENPRLGEEARPLLLCTNTHWNQERVLTKLSLQCIYTWLPVKSPPLLRSRAWNNNISKRKFLLSVLHTFHHAHILHSRGSSWVLIIGLLRMSDEILHFYLRDSLKIPSNVAKLLKTTIESSWKDPLRAHSS